jgi:hypothetical protein
VRKLVLEMLQRLPANDYLKPHARSILLLTFKLLQYENEDNVLVRTRSGGQCYDFENIFAEKNRKMCGFDSN